MRDPRRLLEGDGTEFERALLRAVVAERPSRELHRKMRLGIGLVGGAAVVKAASANWNQIAMMGVVVAGLVTGGAVIAQRDPAPPAPLPAPVSVPAEPPAAQEPEVLEPIPEKVEVVPAPTPEPAPGRVRRADGAKAGAPVPDIREEIRLLDQARKAVRSGDSAQALRVLGRYDQRFPRGQFRQEVLVLRMEALAQRGDGERASVLAKKFLSDHPNSPHVERVENVGRK